MCLVNRTVIEKFCDRNPKALADLYRSCDPENDVMGEVALSCVPMQIWCAAYLDSSASTELRHEIIVIFELICARVSGATIAKYHILPALLREQAL